MSNLTVENVYTRQAAKELVKKHFWKLLGMLLTVFAISYAVIMVGVSLLTLTTGISLNAMENDMSVGFSPLFIIGYFVLMAVTMLVIGGLNLGLIRAMIDLCRGDETVTVKRVFCRMGQCLKALGLSLWVGLKIMLWMLPGYALIMFITVFLVSSAGAEAAEATEATIAMLSILPLLGMILIFALVIPAIFRYYLSTYILADEPQTSVFNCVKQSKAMMKGHKWQAFKLTIPYLLKVYGWMFAIVLVLTLVMAVLGEAAESVAFVLSIALFVVLMALVLIYALCTSMCHCLFYLKRKGELDSPNAE